MESTLCFMALIVAIASWEIGRQLSRIRARSIDEHAAFIDRIEQDERRNAP